jgi:hypothetical protein
MPTLTVAFTIDLTEDEVSGLGEAIGCADGQVATALAGFAKGALREHADMMLGVAPITTASDLRERRLVGMILMPLAGRIPDVNRVARLFSIAPAAARSLLRQVTSKHRRRIAAALTTEVDAFVDGCIQAPGASDWTVTVLNPVLIEVLNARLESAGQSKERIRSSPDALGLYVVPNGSYEWIKANR